MNVTIPEKNQIVIYMLLAEISMKTEKSPESITSIMKQGNKLKCVYENGQINVKINTNHETKNEITTGWYENGIKSSERNEWANIRQGISTNWYENGQKHSECNFTMDT